MVSGAHLLDAVIKSSEKVRACDFSHLDAVKRDARSAQHRDVVGSLMIKKKPRQGGERANYTFVL